MEQPLLKDEPSLPSAPSPTSSTSSLLVTPSPEPSIQPHGYIRYFKYPHLWHACIYLSLALSSDFLIISKLPDVHVTFFNNGHDCLGEAGKSPDCKHAESRAALVTGIVSGAQAIIALFAAPVTGRMSDAYGRLPILLLAQFLAILPPCCLLLHIYVNTTMWIYYIANIFTTVASPLAVALAYVADVSLPQDRSFSFGMALACVSVFWCAGPLIGAQLGSIVFPISTCLSTSAFLFILFCTPESLPLSSRSPMIWAAMNPITNLKILTRTKMFRRLSICIFFSTLATMGPEGIVVMYMKHQFGLSQNDVALNAAIFGATGTLVQSVILKLLVGRFNNRSIMLMGLSVGIFAFPLYGIIWDRKCMFFITALSAFGYLWFPAVSAMKSNNVAESEQGSIQGAILAIRSLAMGFGPLICSSLFSLFTSDSVPNIPAFPFYLGGVLGIIGFYVGCKVPRTNRALVIPDPEAGKHVIENPDIPGSDSEAEDEHESISYHPTSLPRSGSHLLVNA